MSGIMCLLNLTMIDTSDIRVEGTSIYVNMHHVEAYFRATVQLVNGTLNATVLQCVSGNTLYVKETLQEILEQLELEELVAPREIDHAQDS